MTEIEMFAFQRRIKAAFDGCVPMPTIKIELRTSGEQDLAYLSVSNPFTNQPTHPINITNATPEDAERLAHSLFRNWQHEANVNLTIRKDVGEAWAKAETKAAKYSANDTWRVGQRGKGVA